MLAPHTENVNAPTPEGHTPLQVAVCKGHVEVVKFLVSIIENPNEPDISGLTPGNWFHDLLQYSISYISMTFIIF